MNSGIREVILAATVLGAAAIAVAAVSQDTQRSNSPLIVGLDHIPLAVTDLVVAAERYRQLGFTLKQGRPHENGIRNQHVKFRDAGLKSSSSPLLKLATR
jgi:hypothetical protein